MENFSKIKWLLASQSTLLFGNGLIFPFYVIYIREVGANFTEFSIAYALFAISGAFIHSYVGSLSDKIGRRVFLVTSSWGTAILLLFFPIASEIYHVYILQILLGAFSAIHRTSEKSLVGDITSATNRGKQIGQYHGYLSLFSAVAIMTGGYLIDLFDLSVIFYLGSLILFVSGFFILKYEEKK